MNTHLHKDRRIDKGIVDSQEKVGHEDNGRIMSPRSKGRKARGRERGKEGTIHWVICTTLSHSDSRSDSACSTSAFPVGVWHEV